MKTPLPPPVGYVRVEGRVRLNVESDPDALAWSPHAASWLPARVTMDNEPDWASLELATTDPARYSKRR